MKLFVIGLPVLVLVTACTISVTTVHTQGSASDVVDEQQSADPTVDTQADVSLPLADYSVGGRDVGCFQA